MYLLHCNETVKYLNVKEDRKYEREQLLLFFHKHHYNVLGVIQKWIQQIQWLIYLKEFNILT